MINYSIDVSDLSFIFVIPMSQKIHEEKWHVLFFIQMKVVVSRMKWRRLGKVTEYRLVKSGKVRKFRGHFQVKNLLWVVMIWVFWPFKYQPNKMVKHTQTICWLLLMY